MGAWLASFIDYLISLIIYLLHIFAEKIKIHAGLTLEYWNGLQEVCDSWCPFFDYLQLSFNNCYLIDLKKMTLSSFTSNRNLHGTFCNHRKLSKARIRRRWAFFITCRVSRNFLHKYSMLVDVSATINIEYDGLALPGRFSNINIECL